MKKFIVKVLKTESEKEQFLGFHLLQVISIKSYHETVRDNFI